MNELFWYHYLLIALLVFIGLVAVGVSARNISRIFYLMLRGDKNTRKALWLLLKIYKSWAICLVRILDYSKEEKKITAIMHAPRDYSYTRQRVECVTGIQYELALSELAYIFIHFLIDDGVATLISADEYQVLQDLARRLIDAKNLRKDLHRQRKLLRKKAESEKLTKVESEIKEVADSYRKLKEQFEVLTWKKFSPEKIIRLSQRKFEQLLFEHLMSDYKLVFLRKEIVYIKRAMVDEYFALGVRLQEIKKTEQGFPLTVLKVRGETMVGKIDNAALINEIKAQG